MKSLRWLFLLCLAWWQPVKGFGQNAQDWPCSCKEADCLYLEGLGLQTLPDSILGDGPLRTASLGENKLTQIPSNLLQRHPYLTCLDMYGNEIGHVKDKAAKFPRMESLNLSSNQLKNFGAGLDAPKLTSLSLGGNPLERIQLSAAQVPNLVELNLNNCLFGRLRLKWADFEHLEKLDLSENLLTSVPNGLNEMPALKDLDLSGNPFFGDLCIDDLPATLESLNLRDCGIERLKGEWGRFWHVESLNLAENNLLEWPSEISKLLELRELELNGKFLQQPQEVLREICKMQHLELLAFRSADIEELPREIMEMRHLIVLDLRGCRLRHLPDFLLSCPSLAILYLDGNPIPPSEVEKLREMMPDLEVRI